MIFTLVYLGLRGAIVTAAICAAVKVMDILPVAAIVDFMQGIKPRVKAEEALHTAYMLKKIKIRSNQRTHSRYL